MLPTNWDAHAIAGRYRNQRQPAFPAGAGFRHPSGFGGGHRGRRHSIEKEKA
jgi:hypothetical protein